MDGPDPADPHPMKGFPQACFIRNTVWNPNIIVGEYTYYDDPEDPEDFERNVLYHFPFIADKLIIGKFCATARGEVHHERRDRVVALGGGPRHPRLLGSRGQSGRNHPAALLRRSGRSA